MLYNRVDCKIVSRLGTLKLDVDPIGMKDAETQIGRSENTYGIFVKEINNVEFTGKAKDYLENLYLIDGVNADAKLIKREKHPQTDEWYVSSEGFLDFTTRKIERNKLKLDYVEGGLRELLASQAKEKFELNRSTDVKGNPISAFRNDNLLLEGRDIYLLSKLSSEGTTAFVVKSGLWISQGDYRDAHRTAPLTVIANSDPENIANPIESLGDKGNHIQGGRESKFYVIADRDRGKIVATLNLEFTIQDVYTDDSSANEMKVFLRRYRDERESGGDEFTVDSDQEIVGTFDPRGAIGTTFTPETLQVTFDPNVTTGFTRGIQKGDSFGFYFYTRGIYGDPGIVGDTGQMQVFINNYTASIDWSEDSFYSQTTASVLRAFDVGNRLTEIYTGKPAFKSSLLDTDYWKHLVMSCGFWIRNMKKKVEEGVTEERTMTISFEDYYKSIHALEPVGYGIVTEGNKQYIALEKLRYFFQPVKTIKLGQVSNIKREVAPEFIFSSISTGYMKGGNYEKPLGLDEYNIQSNYITPVTKVETKYEALGASRADSYAVEQARRMQYEQYPDEDTPYDKDNFLLDCKVLLQSNLQTTYEVRTWEDDFSIAPTGVYSPDTAFNLRLTPLRNLKRHSYWFNSATVKYPTNKMRYASSEGNSELTTQLIGEDPLKENSDVLISDLSKPLFEPEFIEFELPFTQEVMDQLLGETKIGGETINNYYGQIEFINEAGQKEKAYLFTAKVKDKIQIKALKAYGS